MPSAGSPRGRRGGRAVLLGATQAAPRAPSGCAGSRRRRWSAHAGCSRRLQLFRPHCPHLRRTGRGSR
eukprot:362730-Chlamydomonas_euryale.AAC.2